MTPQLVRAVCAGCSLGLATLARAQCTWFIDDVPDLDQRRSGDLPSNGSMYCVPTSFTNWFAYLSNRGIPQPLTLDGPRTWQSNAHYQRVTDTVSLLGEFMDTDPEEGTKGGAVPGAFAYAFIACNSDLIVNGDWAFGEGTVPSPATLLLLHQLGAYTVGSYGRYGGSFGGTRDGGHCLTFTGVWDLGCGAAPILQFSDPADDGANSTQSDFRTSLAALTPVTGPFRPSATSNFETRTLYRMDIAAPSGDFLDTIYTILPTSAIFGNPGRSGQLDLVMPFRPSGNPAPASRLFNTAPGSGPILDVASGHKALAHYYITSRTGQQAAGVWKLNLITGVSTRLTINTNPSRLAIGRLGDLYVIAGGDVERWDMSTTPATFVSTYSPSFDVEALAYDDKNDTVLMLSEPSGLGPRRVYTFPRTLTGFGTDRALPVTINGIPCIAPDAEVSGAFFVCSDGSGVLSRIEYDAGAGELVQSEFILHLNAGLTALNVTDANRLVYAVNGTLVEKEKNQAGNWVNRVGSRWTGRTAAGPVSMARSRNNFVASIVNGPSFNNLPDPTIFPSLPTCYANCDNSTGTPKLTANDFQCFIDKFAAQHVYANCDGSTGSPPLTANDFQCFIDRFAAGCP